MKKILSLVLALMMVLSMASTAFAGTFEDLEESKAELKAAADLLSGLKIIEGFPDGEFKPENGVTRAQMAIMLIKARGLATIATDTPSFTDSQNHWAKGYIALAADLGIIEGKGNGIFDPDGPVTYEQAATMMLRALGYTNESINSGKSNAYNGANYRAKAISLNLFKNVKDAVMSKPANRGDVALMLEKNLFNGRVETGDNGRAVLVKDVEDKTVTLLASVAKRSTIKITSKTVASEGVNLAPYMYQNVVAYINDDNQVIYVEESTSVTKSITVTAAEAGKIYTGTTTEPKKVVYAIKDAEVKAFYNNAEVKYTDAITALPSSSATLILETDKDGDIVKDAAGNSVVVGVVANEINYAKFVKNVYKKDSTTFNSIPLPKDKNAKVDLSKVVVTGAVESIEDIELNDVVKAYNSIGDTNVKLVVTRDSIEGKVTKANNTGDYLYIDTLGEFRDSNVVLKVLAEGTFYFDEDGVIFEFAGKQVETKLDYSMIVDTENGAFVGDTIISYPTITVLNSNGEKNTYTVSKDLKYSTQDYKGNDIMDPADTEKVKTDPIYTKAVGTAGAVLLASDFEKGKILSTLITKDGKITKIVLQNVEGSKFDVAVDSKTFDPASNAIVFNYNNKDADAKNHTFSVNTIEQLVALEEVKLANFSYIYNKDKQYSVILITGMAVVQPAPAKYAVIADQQKVANADGKIVHELTVYINGEKFTYLSTEALGKTDVAGGKGLVSLRLTGELVSVVTTQAAITVKEGSDASAKDISLSRARDDKFISKTYGDFFMAEKSAIYVYNAKGEFVRVGSMTDLEGLNIEVDIYRIADINGIPTNVVRAIVITLK